MLLMQKLHRYTRNLFAVMTLGSVMLLQGCSNDSASGYNIGGTITGLNGTIVLLNNGGDNLTVSSNGNFKFNTTITSGGDYSVTVSSQPSSQACLVTNASGKATAEVTSVKVECADPVGYYNGAKLTVNNGVTTDSALQAMIYNNRLMILSLSNTTKYLYDGIITITGTDYTTVATIYTDGIKTGTTTITGTVIAGSSITGSLSGSGVGQGNFTSMTYSTTSDTTAATTRVGTEVKAQWTGVFPGSTANMTFVITSSTNTIADSTTTSDGTYKDCIFNGDPDSITPISGTNIYSLNVYLQNNGSCGYVNIYTGYATTTTPGDDTFLMVFQTGDNAVYGEFK